MIKVSIIIPIYNSEQYLEKCLDSVMNQTLKDIEIICVNDGSTDNSLKILYKYQDIDSRIKIINKSNGGLVSARKAGVNAAAGQYIGYVDSDDYIEIDMYDTMYEYAQNGNVDMVTCGYYLNGQYVTEHVDTLDEGLYTSHNIQYLRDNAIYRSDRRETGLRASICCKLFKSSLLKSVQNAIPDSVTIAEDKACLISFILKCSSVYVLKKPLYHWVKIPNSMSRASVSYGNDYLYRINEVYNYFVTLYDDPFFSDIMRSHIEIHIMELIIAGINNRMGFKNTNMLWIDPYWMEQIPANSKVVLYGAGELGEKYRKQLIHSRQDVIYVGCVDESYTRLTNALFVVESPDMLNLWDYDYVVITIKNRAKVEAIINSLKDNGIDQNKIIWCRQPEIYWKYIEAEGIV